MAQKGISKRYFASEIPLQVVGKEANLKNSLDKSNFIRHNELYICMTDGFRGSPRGNADSYNADRLGDSG